MLARFYLPCGRNEIDSPSTIVPRSSSDCEKIKNNISLRSAYLTAVKELGHVRDEVGLVAIDFAYATCQQYTLSREA
jgi:hypothetical protein